MSKTNTPKTYWRNLATRQFKEVIHALEDCKKNTKTGMIIGGTGLGKTNAIELFCEKNDKHTYRITVSSLYRLIDIVYELTEKLGLENRILHNIKVSSYSLKMRIDRIVVHLREISENGGKPIIIIDEAENMEIPTLKMLKGLYDAVKDHCSIVMIGTEQLMEKLLNLRKRNRDGIPQLYRRFKAGIKSLSPLNKARDFMPFFEALSVKDKDLQDLLLEVCENYGELHDYLEPTLRYADRYDQELTEDLFRIMHDMPKTKTKNVNGKINHSAPALSGAKV